MARPNFLIIMSDQHNPRVMAHTGDEFVRTPNLDRLAASGVSFGNNYCAGPLCVPSRMTFLASQYPTDIEVWTNGGVLSSDVPTFAHPLSLAGYETTLCGRMHFVGPDQHHGFERRLVGDVSGAMRAIPSGRFEEVWSPAGCGQRYEGLLDDAVGPGLALYESYDRDVTERTCRFLEEHSGQSGDDRPFCLVVGMLLPHNPYVCAKELFDEYMDKLPAPENVGVFPDDEHPAVRELRRYRGTDRITPEQARRAQAAYYGLVTTTDQNVGRIMDALAEAGLAEDTVFMYTSDHGDMAGEHSLWWKDSFYEGSVGVPMIWSCPSRFQQNARPDAVTGLLDVGPTLTDLAGADPLPGARGHSLVPLLESDGDAADWPDTAFAETYAIGQRPARMLRSGRWKLVVYHGSEHPQLFDMVADPDETNDLGTDPEYAEIRRNLTDLVTDGWSGDWIERRVDQQAAEIKLTRQAAAQKKDGESEVWAMREGMNVREPE